MPSHTTQTFQAIVLAAGNSSRFKTTQSKLQFQLCGKELLAYPLTLLKTLEIPIILVAGKQQHSVGTILKKHDITADIAVQEEQLGTGHAVLCSQSLWHADHLIILNGDVPLDNQDIIQSLIEQHTQTKSAISFVRAYYPIANNIHSAYGRVISTNTTTMIVEARDMNARGLDPHNFPYINAGIYIVQRQFLEYALQRITQNDTQKNNTELYITDLVELAHIIPSDTSMPTGISMLDVDINEVQGVNTLKELYDAEKLKKTALTHYWMVQGVRFIDPLSVQLDTTVSIGPDTVIYPGVILRGATTIGRHCSIDAYTIIDNTTIHDHTTILSHSVIEDAVIQSGAEVGPFARLRKKAHIGAQTVIGNFVEVAQSTIGARTKAKHLAYLGMTHTGTNVNIGAGTITCNYNGITKQKTDILDNAFIGSNSSLIAPVTIGQSALIGAGSVITENVPDNALALGRSRQVVKQNYAPTLRKKYAEKVTSHD